MIIWSGWGILTAVFAIAGLGLGAGLADAAGADPGLGVALGLLAAAAANYAVSRRLENSGRVVVDPQSGERLLLKKKHSLFFIPMKYYTWVLAGLAVLGSFGLLASGG